MILMTREYEPIHLWTPAAVESKGAALKRLAARCRDMDPFEKAICVRAEAGIEPILTIAYRAVGYSVLSLTHYPHQHFVRAVRDGYRCDCEATRRCWHLELTDLYISEHGEDASIVAFRQAA